MTVQIMSRKQFEEYAFQPHKYTSIVISISSCGDYTPFVICNNANKIVSILSVIFNDTDDTNPIYGAINERIAYEIAQFIHIKYNNTIDKIIVHCDYGQCRSPGVGAAILKYYTGVDTQIFDNPRYKPNMLCYRLTLNALYNLNS